MTLNELIKVIDGKCSINSDKEIKGIKTDSRKVEKGDIFIAIRGDKYDGHDFVYEALQKGAITCITEEFISDLFIEVDSTIESLFLIANHIRNKYDIPLIAITGSNGKTTLKDLIYEILSTNYNVLKNEGSKNNIIGVSDTLFRLNDTYDIIVMEFGTNHIGEINKLSLMCNPSTSIITNIGTAHIGYFKNKRNIFKEKYSIVNGMKNKKLIVNGDDKYLKNIDCYKCGKGKNSDLKAYNIEGYVDYISFNIYLDKEYKIVFNNPGVHFVNNILIAIKIGLDYGIDINDIIDVIKNYKLTEKRMNIEKIDSNIIINDCYNSSLESISAGIDYLNSLDGDKVIIIGDILELGKYSKRIHKKINRKLKRMCNKQVFTIGNYSRYINGINFSNVDDFINYINKNEIHNKYIYIKGSRRMNLDKIVYYMKNF